MWWMSSSQWCSLKTFKNGPKSAKYKITKCEWMEAVTFWEIVY